MRKVKELDVFIMHFDWWEKDEKGFFVPTSKAPPEAIDAMKKANKLHEYDLKNNCHII